MIYQRIVKVDSPKGRRVHFDSGGCGVAGWVCGRYGVGRSKYQEVFASRLAVT